MMTYCETVLWTLFGAAIGAGLSVWLAITVERYRVRARFKRLKEFACAYVASEVQNGKPTRDLFWVRLDVVHKTPGVLKITGLSRGGQNPEFTGELVFTDRLVSASGSYVHDGNPNMFGFFDMHVLAGMTTSFHVHQRFINNVTTVLRNEVWNRYDGPPWTKPVPEEKQSVPVAEVDPADKETGNGD